MAVTGYDIGKQLCDALGLDIKGVRTIDIHVEARSLVTVSVERLVSRDEAGRLCTALERYNLHPVGDESTSLQGDVAYEAPTTEEMDAPVST